MTEIIARLNAALEGRYRIERELGEGGMATVFLADDLRHDRKVALKVLKPELAAVVGAERFLAEIKTTAQLQHPHILPLHDSGEADSFLYYVMPFVEGESLRGRIDRQKQLPVDEAVRITIAVAGALDYAHRHGVIHRDIKPANILMQDGQPVVADFGIALAVGAAGARLTETGLSLGTPYYMSPEQATGDQEVGPGSDIYSLACVLYETLTGDPPYTGSTAQAVLGHIIAGEARPASALRRSVPTHIDAALRQALERLPADRFASAEGFGKALQDPDFRYGGESARTPGADGQVWARLGPVLAALLVAVTVIAVLALLRPAPDGAVVRFQVELDSTEAVWYTGLSNLPRLSIAPDGSKFVYVGVSGGREEVLWLHSMDQLNGQRLTGTEGGGAPTISPDGSRVAYRSASQRPGDEIRVVSLAGGSPVTLVEEGVSSGPFWAADGAIYFIADDGMTLARVPGGGGVVDTVLSLDLGDRYEAYAHPFVFPNGRAAIVTALPGNEEMPEVHVVDLATGESKASVVGTGGRLTPRGYLAFVMPGAVPSADRRTPLGGGALMAQEFDPGSLTLEGTAVPVDFGLDVRNNAIVDLTLSETGTLLYSLENMQAPERWVWVDADGQTELLDPGWTEDEEFEGLALSRDGSRLAVELLRDGRWDVWVKRIGRGAPSRLTFRGDENGRPAWSPDGQRIAFISRSESGQDAYTRKADGSGSAELLLDLDRDIDEVLWSPDSRWLLAVLPRPNYDIVALEAGAGGEPQPLLAGPYNEFEPAISPDGRWLAYVSEETGRAEVFVAPFPNVSDGKWQLSNTGGREPHWSADGSRLFIRHEDGSGMDVVDMSEGPIAPGRRTLFDVPPEEYYELNEYNRLYDLAPDDRVLMLRAGAGDTSGALVMVQNWEVDVEKRLAEGAR